MVALLLPLSAFSLAGSPAAASPARTEFMVLAAESQPKVHRPALERLKRNAARKGISLEHAVAAYIANKAKTDPAATANWPDGPVDIPDVTIDDLSAAHLEVLKGMAQAQGVSFSEAIERHGSWPAAKQKLVQLQRTFKGDFAGGERAADGSHVWLGFKGDIPAPAVETAKTLPFRVELQGRLGYTEAELNDTKKRVHHALRDDPRFSDVASYYDAKTGTVHSLVVPATAAKASVQEDAVSSAVTSLVTNPSITVDVTVTEKPVASNFSSTTTASASTSAVDPYIRGGGNLGDCTSNFNVVATWDYETRRHATAGHCSNGAPTRTYCNYPVDGGNCTGISLTNSCWLGCDYGEAALYTRGGLTLTRTFYWSSNQKAYVDAEDPIQWVGDAVCKWGKSTGTTCGTVQRTNWSNGTVDNLYVTSERAGTKCDGGDSGGPAFTGGPSTGFTAYGIVVGEGALAGETALYCAYSHVTVYRDAFGYRIWNRE
ncbi:S1 family peptidase [Nonomuraea sp. ATR24]|uniref:S1 family peptidase n=1 Tax=Nonomuraea sp. ATR24 TaxID=1676744 RepID=UPI0035C10E86